jgi:hypothetical protein
MFHITSKIISNPSSCKGNFIPKSYTWCGSIGLMFQVQTTHYPTTKRALLTFPSVLMTHFDHSIIEYHASSLAKAKACKPKIAIIYVLKEKLDHLSASCTSEYSDDGP